MFIALIIVMDSWVFTWVKTSKTVHFKHIHYICRNTDTHKEYLSEVSQTKKHKYHTILLIRRI